MNYTSIPHGSFICSSYWLRNCHENVLTCSLNLNWEWLFIWIKRRLCVLNRKDSVSHGMPGNKRHNFLWHIRTQKNLHTQISKHSLLWRLIKSREDWGLVITVLCSINIFQSWFILKKCIHGEIFCLLT